MPVRWNSFKIRIIKIARSLAGITGNRFLSVLLYCRGDTHDNYYTQSEKTKEECNGGKSMAQIRVSADVVVINSIWRTGEPNHA